MMVDLTCRYARYSNGAGAGLATTTTSSSFTYQGSAAKVSSIGALVIEVSTTLAACFLFLPLYRQGIRRLRTKLLIGMVLSDLFLGLVGFVPTSIYLSGRPMVKGSKSCDALGFFLTSVLFTQHLWTLAIAIATFALLKYPMSRFTYLLHAHWYLVPISIWVISVAHSVGWYKAYGFVPSSGGSLCYYGGSRNLDRELVQFIPRAVVFVVVIYLYARLFRFLRRPDAISLSGSGKDTADLKDVRGQQDCSQESRGAWHKFKGGIRKTFGMTPQAGSLGQTNSVVPPWELLHINIAGLDLDAIPNSVVLPVHEKMLPLSLWSSPPASDERARSVRINTASTLVSSNDGRNNSHDSQPKQQAVIDEKSHESIAVPVLLINRELSPNSLAALDEPPSPFQLDGIGYSGPLSKPEYGGGMTIKNKPSSVTFNPNEDHKEEEDDQRPAEHSLRNFFQANRASESEVRDAHAGDDIRPEESAAAYSNRQASLLMIYFPLSYMAVFSISLVRLMHDMITSKTSVALTTISLWFVLSAGLTDALVYGVAEYVIRRRVRKNLPDHDFAS